MASSSLGTLRVASMTPTPSGEPVNSSASHASATEFSWLPRLLKLIELQAYRKAGTLKDSNRLTERV